MLPDGLRYKCSFIKNSDVYFRNINRKKDKLKDYLIIAIVFGVIEDGAENIQVLLRIVAIVNTYS